MTTRMSGKTAPIKCAEMTGTPEGSDNKGEINSQAKAQNQMRSISLHKLSIIDTGGAGDEFLIGSNSRVQTMRRRRRNIQVMIKAVVTIIHQIPPNKYHMIPLKKSRLIRKNLKRGGTLTDL